MIALTAIKTIGALWRRKGPCETRCSMNSGGAIEGQICVDQYYAGRKRFWKRQVRVFGTMIGTPFGNLEVAVN